MFPAPSSAAFHGGVPAAIEIRVAQKPQSDDWLTGNWTLGNQAKRLIKTPKVHLVDSGLTATLSGLTEEQWHTDSTTFGPLLESFAVQQLICQADWHNRELRFSHYRDKDQVEVDLVIERGREIWGVEVKKAAGIQPKDGAGLSRLAAQAGKQFRGGILLYAGNNTLALATPNCFAVPLDALWR
jgi:hypothetical protein